MNVFSYLGLGIVHERSGLPCQDSIAYHYADNGNIILALSDGASAAKFAADASREAVLTVVDFFTRVPLSVYARLEENEQKSAILTRCFLRLKALQMQYGEPDLRQFSCTLLFVVADENQTFVGHLGDGFIAVIDPSGRCLFASQPEQIDQYENATYFVVSKAAYAHFRLKRLSAGTGGIGTLTLLSDGSHGMFQNRGLSDPVATVRELQGFISHRQIVSNQDLAYVLNRMTRYPYLRADDWSVLIWSSEAKHTLPDLPAIPVSMLHEENMKYGIESTTDLAPVSFQIAR